MEEYITLDANHVVKTKRLPENGLWQGEVIMLPHDRVEGDMEGTRLFNTPAQQDREQLKEWASRALKAYREG